MHPLPNKLSSDNKRKLLSLCNWIRQVIYADPLNWTRLPAELVHYFGTLRKYRKNAAASSERIYQVPILFQRENVDFDAQSTLQAAWASRRILGLNPRVHLDISSDIRFVTQLSASIPVLFVEFRPINLRLSGLSVLKGDILGLPFIDSALRSVSCLHVIEHIGLGRYGDTIDNQGSQKAVNELSRIVARGGSLFISVPIGRPRTMFNAHRVFHPGYVPSLISDMRLVEFSGITTTGKLLEHTEIEKFAEEEYACGLYWMIRE